MPDAGNARAAGRKAVAGVRRTLAQHAAELLKRDPERMATAVEMGLVRREWLEEPGGGPISTATPVGVVERFLERSVEQRPSVLSQLGLSAIQILSSTSSEGQPGEGSPARLAIAFTDLESFTRYTSQHGDEAAIRLLAAHHRQVGPIVRSRGGRVVKHLGDGLLLTFPEPEAAVLACLELAALDPEPLRLRAGIHVGEVVATRDDVIGHVVNVSARVTETAKGGQVLVTGDVRDAIGELRGVTWGRSRRRRLKGVGEPVAVLAATAG